MKYPGVVGMVALATILSFCISEQINAAPAPKAKAVENKKVSELFASMRAGTYRDQGFPKLELVDVPALLELAESTESLQSIPSNPLSSLAQLECSEGVVALWFIEGIRKGGKYPSLNPKLISPDPNTSHKTAIAAYRDWWRKAKNAPAEASKLPHPLNGTSLSWY